MRQRAGDHAGAIFGVYLEMLDTNLIADQLRKQGHKVDEIVKLPANAGDWEFRVDGEMLTLVEARALIADEQHTA